MKFAFAALALTLVSLSLASTSFAGTFVSRYGFPATIRTAPTPPCTPGSLGYTHYFGPYGEPLKKDNCTGQITPDY